MGRFRKLLRIGIILLVIAILGLLFFRIKFNDAIRSLAETQVKNATSDLINDAIDRQIEDGNVNYDRMVYFEKDLDGFIKEEIMTISEEVREGIISEGVWLIGGCSLLRGLSDRLERSLNLSIHIPADPRFVISGGL